MLFCLSCSDFSLDDDIYLIFIVENVIRKLSFCMEKEWRKMEKRVFFFPISLYNFAINPDKSACTLPVITPSTVTAGWTSQWIRGEDDAMSLPQLSALSRVFSMSPCKDGAMSSPQKLNLHANILRIQHIWHSINRLSFLIRLDQLFDLMSSPDHIQWISLEHMFSLLPLHPHQPFQSLSCPLFNQKRDHYPNRLPLRHLHDIHRDYDMVLSHLCSATRLHDGWRAKKGKRKGLRRRCLQSLLNIPSTVFGNLKLKSCFLGQTGRSCFHSERYVSTSPSSPVGIVQT